MSNGSSARHFIAVASSTVILLLTACGGGDRSASDVATQVSDSHEHTLAIVTDNSVSNTVNVVVSATLAAGVGPTMEVRVGGSLVGRTEVRNTSPASYQFNAPDVSANTKVDIAFVDDLLPGIVGRTLTVASVRTGSTSALQANALNSLYTPNAGASTHPTTATWPMTSHSTLSIPVPAPTWTQCGTEWNTCSLSSPSDVRYVRFGASGQYAYKVVKGSVGCYFAANGTGLSTTDPAPGKSKTCESSSAVYVSQPGPGVYVDSVVGSDANGGTFAKPWKTLAKVMQGSSAAPTIFLQCGQVWRESLVLTGARLSNSDASGKSLLTGSGNCAQGKAIVSGADDISKGWTQVGSGVWKHAMPANAPKVAALFINGVAQRIAQWPNYRGYGKEYAIGTSQATDASTFYATTAGAPTEADKQLFAANTNNVVGATVRMRVTDYSVDTATVAGYSASQFVLSGAQDGGSMHPNMGYVLQDKLWMLDAPGEFYHDVANGLLYVYPSDNNAQTYLNSFNVEGSTRDIAVKLSAIPRLKVTNIGVSKASFRGLDLAGGTASALIDNIEARDNAWTGSLRPDRVAAGLMIELGTEDSVISNSRFDGNGMGAIYSNGVSRINVSRNWISNSGVSAYAGHSSGAIFVGADTTVDSNVVRSSALNGIHLIPAGDTGTNKNRITNNVVEDSCLRFSDGGGIYVWDIGVNGLSSNHGTIISGNVAVRAHGNAEAAVSVSQCTGVYLDTYIANAQVTSNVIADVDYGIELHRSMSTKVDSNKVWNASTAALFIPMDATDVDYSATDSYTNNQWNVVSPLAQNSLDDGLPIAERERTAYPVYIQNFKIAPAAVISGLGSKFSGNQILSLTRNLAGITTSGGSIQGAGGTVPISMTSDEWRLRAPSDVASDLNPAQYKVYQGSVGPELIANGYGSFSNGLAGWSSYINSGATQPTLQTGIAGCPGTCARVPVTSIHDGITSPAFSVSGGSTYVVTYNLVFTGGLGQMGQPISASLRGFGYIPTMAGGRDGALAPQSMKLTSQTIVTATASNSAAKMQFSANGVFPFAVGGVSVKAITGLTFVQPRAWLSFAYREPIATDRAPQFDCVQLGFPNGCAVSDVNNVATNLPITPAAVTPLNSPANSAMLWLRTDDANLKQ